MTKQLECGIGEPTLDPAELAAIDAYWRAAEGRAREAATARTLGNHSGLKLLDADMNRLIRERDLNVLCVTGPGHGGPGLVRQSHQREEPSNDL